MTDIFDDLLNELMRHSSPPKSQLIMSKQMFEELPDDIKQQLLRLNSRTRFTWDGSQEDWGDVSD